MAGVVPLAATIPLRGYEWPESSSHVRASKKNPKVGMKIFEKLVQEISSWPQVSVHPHRFGGREFRFGAAEIGHLHTGGILDIPFPRSVRDALLAGGLAEEHRWVPNSGWITFHVRGEGAVEHALWLMRLSYLRYKLKTVTQPQSLLEQESGELHLTPGFKSLLVQLLPARPSSVSESHDTERGKVIESPTK